MGPQGSVRQGTRRRTEPVAPRHRNRRRRRRSGTRLRPQPGPPRGAVTLRRSRDRRFAQGLRGARGPAPGGRRSRLALLIGTRPGAPLGDSRGGRQSCAMLGAWGLVMIAAAWTTGSTIRPRRASGNGRLRVAPRVAPLFASAALLVGAAPALAEQAAHQEPVGAGLSGSAPPLQVSSPGEAESARRARELTDAAIRHEEAEGAARSFARAYALYCEAARLDPAGARMRMGWMHAQGRGRPREDAIANTLFSRAAGVVGGHDKLPECLRKPYGPLTVAEPEPEPAQPT